MIFVIKPKFEIFLKNTKNVGKFLILFWIFAWGYDVFASTNELYKTSTEYTLDVYKTNQVETKDIKKKIRGKIKKIVGILTSPESLRSKKNIERINELIGLIDSDVRSMGDFSYLSVSFSIYPKDQVTHFMIDIVDKKDYHRLSYFLPNPKRDIADPNHLISLWRTYKKTGMSILLKKKKLPAYTDKKCPGHKCFHEFEHDELKKYEDTFSQQVSRNKQQLINILRKDKKAGKRSAAVFLLAYLKNGGEVIKILLPSILDPDPMVRNNAILVIGTIVSREKLTNTPVKPFVMALNFPSRTDRQKAMYVIEHLVEEKNHATYVKDHALQLLLDQLKMSQPYLHDPAYQILKKISGKTFKERDYKAWEQWVKSMKQKPEITQI